MGYSKAAAIGLGWVGVLKIFIRTISFLRLFVLARLLTPVDFGVFAIAALVLAFLEIFTETGINIFLIQSKEENTLKKYLNTAWVVSILRGFLMFLLILILSKPISLFFNTPEAISTLVIISFVPLVKGFINPSIINFQKELEFKKEFYLRSAIVVIDSFIAIIFALITRSPESLAYGILAGALIETIFSMLFIKPVPKFKFNYKRFKTISSNGKWVTVNGIVGYLAMNGDDAVVAKLLNATQLGYYQIAYRFALLPGTEVTEVVGRVAFPAFSKISDDRNRLRRAYFKTLLLTSILAFPIGLILILFPNEIIKYSVGEQWLPAAETLQVLSAFGMIGSILGTRNSVLFALKRQDIAAKISIIKLSVLSILIIPLVSRYGIIGAAYSSLIAIIAIIPFTMYYLGTELYEKK